MPTNVYTTYTTTTTAASSMPYAYPTQILPAELKVDKLTTRLNCGKEGHQLRAELLFTGNNLIVQVSCTDCDKEVSRKVLWKLSKKLKKEKCLPRMVKEIK